MCAAFAEVDFQGLEAVAVGVVGGDALLCAARNGDALFGVFEVVGGHLGFGVEELGEGLLGVCEEEPSCGRPPFKARLSPQGL